MWTTFILFIYYILFGLNNTISTATWEIEKNKLDISYRSLSILYSKVAGSKIYAIYTILYKGKKGGDIIVNWAELVSCYLF